MDRGQRRFSATLAHLPPKAICMTSPDYPVLVLRRGEDRRLRAGHLWVFSNEVDVAHTVTGTGPALANYSCSCVAGQHARVCWHVASVHLRRVQEDAKAQWKRMQARRSTVATAPTSVLAEAA